MKKIFALMLFAIAASVSATILAGTPINQSELPKNARTFITKYLPNDEIWKVEQDRGYSGLEYDVDFTSGAEVDFSSDGEWKEFKAARGKAVPDAIVPKAIAKYVQTNFEGQNIVEITRRRGGYEIELTNGSELRLTEDAKPMQRRNGNGGGRGNRH